MNKQPEALRLADILDEPDVHYPGNFNTPKRANALLMGLAQEAADELRRLHAINAQLLEALESASNYVDNLGGISPIYRQVIAVARSSDKTSR
jgi:hypothetical protein